ncbi:hypothetical protein FHS75_002569 [Novosphingobium marinum]|uniref:Uncharacterized protein n=1 Tax=Novosphingobium marinum TaxID=1514948 RepID=A0A7Y9XX85_9SPHN|nr:hypothetical protein [Novosphingobium marinum]
MDGIFPIGRLSLQHLQAVVETIRVPDAGVGP